MLPEDVSHKYTLVRLNYATYQLLMYNMVTHGDFPGGPSGKDPACQCRICKRHGFHPCVEKIPWRKAWQLTPVFLPRESHGQRKPMGYSPQGHRVRYDWSDLACMHAWSQHIPEQVKIQLSKGTMLKYIKNRIILNVLMIKEAGS